MQIRSSVVVCAVAVLASPLALAAQPLGSEFQVNSYTTSRQTYPSVALDDEGDFVVVWTSNRGGFLAYEEIAAQRFTSAGAPIGTEFRVNTYSYATQKAPVVAAESNGDFVVVWRSRFQDGDGYGIFGQRLTSAGVRIGTEFQVNAFTTAYQFGGKVASDDEGNFVVAWNSYTQDGAGSGVFGQRYDSSGALLGGNFQINTVTLNSQNLPAVAVDGDGDFIVAWSSGGDQDGSDYGIFGQRYASSGAALGSEFQINSYTSSTQFAPAVAAEQNGDFVVSWVSYYQDGNSSGVFAQRFSSGGTAIGGEFQVNTYTSFLQRFVALAGDRSGGFVVTWEGAGQDGAGYGVFGQRYASDGSAFGGEFQVNTHTLYDDERPAVGANGDGAFVVAWNRDDGYPRDNIFAQRFAAPPVCPATPDPGCTTGFGKGLFLVKEKVAGKEKLIAKFLKGPMTTQTDLGNPLSPGGTSYALCIYAGTSHATTLEVDRAGDTTCSGGATDCWVPIGAAPPGGKGYKYKDQSLTADGIFQVQLKGGTTKIIVKGKGPNLPLPIAPSFGNATSVTLQLRGDDMAQCFGVTLTDIKKQEADSFKIK
jgi:hypothetical protein